MSIQDCLWGIYKAMQNGLCDMNEFDVEDYEFYEKVENGDWNWLTPNFIAFASPVDPYFIKKEKEKRLNDVARSIEDVLKVVEKVPEERREEFWQRMAAMVVSP